MKHEKHECGCVTTSHAGRCKFDVMCKKHRHDARVILIWSGKYYNPDEIKQVMKK